MGGEPTPTEVHVGVKTMYQCEVSDIPSAETPIAQAHEFLSSAPPESLLAFCLAPQRTWNRSAMTAVATAIAGRDDDPTELGAAFGAIDGALEGRARERVEELATLFAGKLGAQTPPRVLEWLDFESKHRDEVIAPAWEAFLSAQDPAFVREALLEDPKGRVALFRHAYDAELFRSVLRDPDWKGWVGKVGRPALPEICASLEEDEHAPKRRRMTVESAVAILGRGAGPLEPEEQAAWETVSPHWREVMKELDLVLDRWPIGARELLARIGLEAASEWLDGWDEADLDLRARIQVFALSSPGRQWRVIEDVAAKKRRSKETGDLRRAILAMDDPVAHVAALAIEHEATEAQLELLGEVFRRQKAALQQALQG